MVAPWGLLPSLKSQGFPGVTAKQHELYVPPSTSQCIHLSPSTRLLPSFHPTIRPSFHPPTTSHPSSIYPLPSFHPSPSNQPSQPSPLIIHQSFQLSPPTDNSNFKHPQMCFSPTSHPLLLLTGIPSITHSSTHPPLSNIFPTTDSLHLMLFLSLIFFFPVTHPSPPFRLLSEAAEGQRKALPLGRWRCCVPGPVHTHRPPVPVARPAHLSLRFTLRPAAGEACPKLEFF